MRKILEAIIATFAVVGAVYAVDCPPLILGDGTILSAPGTFTALALVKTSDGSSQVSLPLTATQTTPVKQQHRLTTEDINALRKLRNDLGAANVKFRWSNSTDHCDVAFTFGDELGDGTPPVAGQGQPATGTSLSTDTAACRAGGLAWEKKLRQSNPDGRFGIVILNDANSACYQNTYIKRMAAGDPVYVGVFSTDDFKWSSPQFDPCSLKSSEPAFNAPSTGTTAFALASKREGGGRVLLPTDGPPDEQRCYDPSVTITIEGSHNGSAAAPLQYTLRQYPRYNFTLQLGVERTNLQEHEFSLRTENSKSFINDKGPINSGPEYYAAVVVYAIPRYFQSLSSRREFYPGRDVIHDKGLADRLSLMLGSALQKPTRRFVLGLGFEVADGINVTYTYNYARLAELVGHKVGDEYTGTAESIPTRDVWRRGWAVGLSLDMRYALALFQR